MTPWKAARKIPRSTRTIAQILDEEVDMRIDAMLGSAWHEGLTYLSEATPEERKICALQDIIALDARDHAGTPDAAQTRQWRQMQQLARERLGAMGVKVRS